jgi:hypothetical protein
MRLPIAVLVALSLQACTVDDDDDAVVPQLDPSGKGDAVDRVDDLGALVFGTARTGTFVEDLEFHGYRMSVRDGARVRVEITRQGTAKKLDTTLFVYGPAQAGAFGDAAIAFDDDSGWGKQSRLTGVTLEAGEYLVVVGTHTGRGRGAYRLLTSCENGECDPLPETVPCDEIVANNILACIGITVADSREDADIPDVTPQQALETCTGADALAGVFDRLCNTPQPAGFCPAGVDSFIQTMGPSCHDQLAPFAIECVFGGEFRDLATSHHVVAGTRRILRSAEGLDDIERAQIVAAIQTAGFTDFTAPELAFDEVQDGEINQVEIWDRTNARAYVAYEFALGDTSVGSYFPIDSAATAAVISDGFLGRCNVDVGPQGQDCTSNSDCSVGECVGDSAQSGVGRCTVLTGFGEPTECSADAPCDIGQGTICSGLTRGDGGQCLPAWMRGNFGENDIAASIPDNDPQGLSRTLMVYGLATVDTDVELSMSIEHGDASQLRVTLTNPDGTEVVVSDGPANLFRFDAPVLGFSGDESINGPWTLRVVDQQGVVTGDLVRWSLRLGSRFD